MAITKISKNMTVTVASKYTVVTSGLDKRAEKITIDATKKNLALNCIKKICANGNAE